VATAERDSETPVSHSYVLNKTRSVADMGINSETIVKPASVSEDEQLNFINKL
jgi:methylenetetrahydrofolate dehydrogenase(NAD+)/5,10-methenyltetrahydrofolate cyclohydrolase